MRFNGRPPDDPRVVPNVGRRTRYSYRRGRHADTQGHLRGKRVPAERFFSVTADAGVNIADAMFVLDMQNDLPDNEFINFETATSTATWCRTSRRPGC